MLTNRERSLIKVQDLRHSFGDIEILNLPDWRLYQGENQLLLGPSGCGKTTLISLLTGLSRPSSGDIWIQEQSLSGLRPKKMDQLRTSTFGLIFQDHHLISSLTVGENLTLAQKFAAQALDEDWSNHLLDHLDLADKTNSKPAALSHGEAQRAAIARAAICRPPVIIADEPTSALDDRNTARVMKLLSSLCSEWDTTF